MNRIRNARQGDLFARDVPLPAPTQKELLPLLAALITAVMTTTPPTTLKTGGGDDERGKALGPDSEFLTDGTKAPILRSRWRRSSDGVATDAGTEASDR